MLSSLKFVQGAIAKKDLIPALTHFRIAEGRVSGFNGVLALSAPIDLDLCVMPKAISFAKVIERLPNVDEVVLNTTQAGRLSVKSGSFRAYVECWPDSTAYPAVAPAGEEYAIPSAFLQVLARLAPFVGIDASRRWACGILLKNRSAFATNNIILVEQWTGMDLPAELNIPDVAIKELLRIGRDPVRIQIEERAVTFHYADTSWLRTTLSSTEWPDLSRVLDTPSTAIPLPEGFFDAVHRLDAFLDDLGRLHMKPGVLSTSAEEGDGALVELPALAATGVFHLEQILKLEEVANTIDLSLWPAPCLFFGDQLRGAIVGMRG